MYICRTKRTTCANANYRRNDRKFAFDKGGVCESTPRPVVRPGNPVSKAFFIPTIMYHNLNDGNAFCKAVQIIHAIAELDTAFTKAEAVASTNSWIWEQFTGNRTETMAALGLALHTELSTIYEEEQV